jgi:rubrerythrin
MARDYKEDLERKHAEEVLDRKAKATVQWNYNCSIRMFKNLAKKESLIKQVTCEKCGKSFKTNKDKKQCFRCERKIFKFN